MKIRAVALAAASLCLALGLATSRAEPSLRALQVDMMDSCHKGLVVWKRMKKNDPKCGYVQVPQVKIFDSVGRLRFIGSALDAIQWAQSGQPKTPIPDDVVVRDVASEVRITHVATPSAGHDWVAFYICKDCPPCEKHLAMFRAEVMPKLGLGAGLSIFEI